MEEISAKELLARKTKLVFTATDPLVLDTAFKGVYSGWAAVIAVLKLQFARTVALGSAIGDFATATDLLRWTRSHRCDDGSYYTGIVYPDRITFPDAEHSAYTAAAVVLAADAITATSPASDLFVRAELRPH